MDLVCSAYSNASDDDEEQPKRQYFFSSGTHHVPDPVPVPSPFTLSAHLLASAGMDHAVCIWNVWSRNQKKACVLNFHNAAVKDVKWSRQGHFLLSCGYDCTSRLIYVAKGLETQVVREYQTVGVIKFHPDNSNLFLSGESKGPFKLWDVRTG